MESVSHVPTLLGGFFGVLLLVRVHLDSSCTLCTKSISALSLQPLDESPFETTWPGNLQVDRARLHLLLVQRKDTILCPSAA